MKKLIVCFIGLGVLAGCGGGGAEGDSDPNDVNQPTGQQFQPTDNQPYQNNQEQETPAPTVGIANVRAIIPGDGHSVSEVLATITGNGVDETLSLTINGDEATGTMPDLEPGTYNIEIAAYDGALQVASGSGSVDVEPGDTGEAAINVDWLPGSINLYASIANGTAIGGAEYEGVKREFGECSQQIFSISSSDTTFTFSGNNISIKQDAFFDGVCLFYGAYTEASGIIESASGTFQCANFDEGTWSSDFIRQTADNSFIATLTVDVENRSCSYDVTYIGIR